jgi:hypothetical protein
MTSVPGVRTEGPLGQTDRQTDIRAGRQTEHPTDRAYDIRKVSY